MMVQDIDKREFIDQMFEGTDEEHAMLVEDVADLLGSHATDYKTKLTEFYKEHNPDKLSSVQSNLDKYKGKEDELFRKL